MILYKLVQFCNVFFWILIIFPEYKGTKVIKSQLRKSRYKKLISMPRAFKAVVTRSLYTNAILRLNSNQTQGQQSLSPPNDSLMFITSIVLACHCQTDATEYATVPNLVKSINRLMG
jgi:hypothetical protein